MFSSLNKNSILYILYAGIISFVIGFINYKWFAHFYFDGDFAAYHTLANVIQNEKNLLVKDFMYGNQLILIRTLSLCIAVIQCFGIFGYDAFLLGASINVSIWGIVLYLFLSYYTTERSKALLLSLVLLVPIGYFDSMYILGQQSHLSNVILCFGIILLTIKYLSNGSLLLLILSNICFSLISIESPIRGLLLLVPLLIGINYLLGHRKNKFIYFVTFVINFIISYKISKYIVTNFVTLAYLNEHIVYLHNSSEILDNIIYFIKDMINGVSNINLLAGKKLVDSNFKYIFAYGISLCVIITYTFFAVNSIFNLFKAHKEYKNKNIYIISSIGFLINLFIITCLSPDKFAAARHLMWVIFVIKFLIFSELFNYIKYTVNIRKNTNLNTSIKIILFVVIAIICSSWLSILAKYSLKNINTEINNVISITAIKDIEYVSSKYKINNVYGGLYNETFLHSMMHLNTYSSVAYYAPLFLENSTKKFIPFQWLSKLSIFCHKNTENVIYYLINKNEVDNEIKNLLLQNFNNFEAKVGDDYSIWVGNPVWEIPEYCKNITNNK